MENAPQTGKKIMKQTSNQERIFKVIVVGDSNVGKTSLTYRFCEGKFLDSPEATIGVDFRSKVLWIDDEKITLQLWDTAGQERFRKTMVRHYYRNANAVVFVYDVTNSASFDSLKKWIIEVDLHCPPDIPRILVGNKCDDSPMINTHDAQTFADHHNMPLFETSARLDSEYDNVESIFLTLAHKLKNQKPFFAPKIDLNEMNDPSTNKSGCCS
ncbi:ras-related protein Rab-33B-like [Coccinella septempunctata]|uniref:ras-related protein Rab-33B-like n=1 Tax=Coccinella septempunctata TaxID=41139 RepID=UPI001D092D4F|nr:ras-related protein Rab-33B-like [Coccinella septempunctata]